MYDKLTFNNLLVSSKKQIEKGRAQVIQKCVQKIRKLKTITEKNAQNARHEQNLSKTIMYMELLKKLKPLDIVKGVLLMTKPPSAVLTNGRATADDIVVAMLSTNKLVQVIVERFKGELQLHENDSSWRRQLQETSKRRAKIERTEEKRRRRQQQKEVKAVGRKRHEWLEQHQGKPNVTENVLNTTSGTWKEEEIEMTENLVAVQSAKKPKTMTKEIAPKKEKLKKPAKENVEPMPTKQPKLLESSQPREEEVVHEDEEETTHVIDSFFITNSGENYLSTAIVAKEDNSPAYADQDEFHDRGKTIIGLKHKHHDDGNRRQQRREFQNSEKYTDNQLHPSWAAKQRFKPVINNFQGQRTTFDENANSSHVVHRKNVQEPESSTAEQLHPSWAAKQKLKPVITAFQGKRITFDDNSHSSSVPMIKKTNMQETEAKAVEQLHPSWAAKQKLKPVITPFQGKKTVFQ